MLSEEKSYRNIPSTDSFVDDDKLEASLKTYDIKQRWCKIPWSLAQCALVLCVMAQSVAIVFLSKPANDTCRSIHGMNLQRTEPRRLYQHSKFVSENEDIASEAWDSILPGHGAVAIEPEYALSKSLPDTIELPGSGGKLLYAIEAYHAIHCVAILRKHYTALDRNETWNWSRGHDRHCFDTLRQYIMCNIDDTLLYTWGKRNTGHDQEKKCHDWDRLRDWAEERSASYFYFEPGMGDRHIGNYHEGDGLPIGSLS